MNILIFGWRDPRHPLSGGAEYVMQEHAKGWVGAGHKVTLFAAHFKNAPRHQNLDGVEILRYGYQLLGVHIAGFFWYLFGKHEKFDLVLDQFHGIPFFTPLYVRVKKLAVIQEVAREVWLMNHLPIPFNWIVGWTGYFFEPFIFLFYRRIPFMTGSASAKEDLIKFGIPAKNITVVPHGLTVRRQRPLPKKEKQKTVIFLGALARDKGIESALRTFSILAKMGRFSTKGGPASGWNFWVVGRGGTPYMEYLKNLASDLGLNTKVKFFGYVSQEKKFELLARAHLLVNPSVREGWGLVNLEANAVGTPVVAYRSPGLVDSVKDGESGLICQKNTANDLAETVFNLLNDNDKYGRLQKGALAWAKVFSWNKSKKQSLTLVERISG